MAMWPTKGIKNRQAETLKGNGKLMLLSYSAEMNAWRSCLCFKQTCLAPHVLAELSGEQEQELVVGLRSKSRQV